MRPGESTRSGVCLPMADTAQVLGAYLEVFSNHDLLAKRQLPVDLEDAAHQRLRRLRRLTLLHGTDTGD